MKRKAFTLIELLVVIAIIAILASILFPVFARARENARRTSCMSNLKQMGLGVMQYVQDYDGFYPAVQRYNTEGDSAAGYTYWFGASGSLGPYVKSQQIFICPSSSQGYGPADASYAISHPSYPMSGNYGGNQLLMRVYNATNQPYINIASVVSTATTYMIMDNGAYQAYPSIAVASGASYNYTPGMGAIGVSQGTISDRYVSDFQNGRHFGGINMAFADGHAKWLKAQTIYTQAKKLTDAGWIIGRAPTHPSLQVSSAWNPWIDNN